MTRRVVVHPHCLKKSDHYMCDVFSIRLPGSENLKTCQFWPTSIGTHPGRESQPYDTYMSLRCQSVAQPAHLCQQPRSEISSGPSADCTCQVILVRERFSHLISTSTAPAGTITQARLRPLMAPTFRLRGV